MNQLNISRKAIVPGLNWMILFLSTLIVMFLMYSPLANFQQNEDSSLFIGAIQIQNYILTEKNVISQEISKANSQVQEELLEGNDEITPNIYNSKLDSKLRSKFSSSRFQIKENTITTNITTSANEVGFFRNLINSGREAVSEFERDIPINYIEITQELEFSKFKYKDLFFSQYQTLKSLEENILTNQAGVNDCYQSEFNKNSCHAQIIQSLTLDSNIKCITNRDEINSIECIFTQAPYTSLSTQLPQLAYKDDRRQIELEESLFSTNNEGELELNLSSISPGQNRRGYFIILFPQGSNEANIEIDVNKFEELIKEENDENDENIAYESFIESEKVSSILDNYEEDTSDNIGYEPIEISGNMNRLYKIFISEERKDRNLYVLTSIQEGSGDLVGILMSEIETALGIDSIHSIFITENRYFEDTPMYERGQLFEVPIIEEETQSSNE